MTSALQKEAERQVLSMHNELSLYRQFVSSGFSKPGYEQGKSPAWHISNETFDGDFALDEVLAQKLATNVVSNNPEANWLSDYLNYSPGPDAGFGEQLKDAAFGKTNVSGTLNSTSQSFEAAIAQSKINSAASKIAAGTAQSVKINNHMTLYNANKSGNGRPRLRVKVTRLPLKVISSTLSPNAINPRPLRGGFSARGKDVKSMVELQGFTSKARFFNGKIGGGILTFAPTIAFDVYDTINRDANGNLNWNKRQFINNELKNQPGNAVGMVGGVLVGAIAVSFGVAGAPVIVCVLIGGIAVQALWNWSGAPNQMPQMEIEGGH